MSFISIYITHPDETTAQKIADALIQQKLVACANIFPIQSAYWWQGEVARETEWVSLVKTIPEFWENVCQEVSAKHPYEVPCIMRTEVSANEAYEDWIRHSVEVK